MKISSSCNRQGPNVINAGALSGAVGQGGRECRSANLSTRGFSCLTLEAASYPTSGAGFHIYPPIEAFQHFQCACDTKVTRGIGAECVHDPRSGQEQHMNADGVLKRGSAPAAIVAIKRRSDGYKFPDE